MNEYERLLNAAKTAPSLKVLDDANSAYYAKASISYSQLEEVHKVLADAGIKRG